MDFKRKLGHGLSALFSSDDEIDREIEKMEKNQDLSRDDNPFSTDSESLNPVPKQNSVPVLSQNPFDQQESASYLDKEMYDSSIERKLEETLNDSSASFEYSRTSELQSIQNSSNTLSSAAIQEDSSRVFLDASESDEYRSIENKLSVEQDSSEETNQEINPGLESSKSVVSVMEHQTDDVPDEDPILKEGQNALLSGQDEERMDDSAQPVQLDQSPLKDRIQFIDIYKIEPDRQQPRKSFDSAQLSELAASIKQYGVLSPLLVSKEADYYKIIAGERRYRAARMAGLDQLPVIVREFDEQDKMAVALIENIQRQELNPMEEANAYRTLMDKYRMTQEEIAEKLNKSRSSIANLLRLQKLPESVQKSLSEGLISFGHAKVLLGVEDPIDQTRLALQIVSNNLSVRELEDLVRAQNTGSKKKKNGSKGTGKVQTFSHRLAEDRLKDKLSTKVTVNSGKRKGSISIEFYSQEDLERILSILGI